MSDLELDRTYQRGDTGSKVRLIQEWLCFDDVALALEIDGDFGRKTEAGVKDFQLRHGFVQTGTVAADTFEALVKPMDRALASIAPNGRSMGALVVAYSEQHLAQRPREIGGNNRGPWVRLYMNGSDGESALWCAGFVCFCLKQACDALSVPPPISRSTSCDGLASLGRQGGLFLAAPPPSERNRITPGSIFLIRKSASDWTHTGIVVEVNADGIRTIEGNTNDEGSREGYEVCSRNRKLDSTTDFLLI